MSGPRGVPLQRLAAVIVLVASGASVAEAQQSAGAWGPVLREVSASVANRLVFRGYDIGSPGYEASAVVPLYGHTVVDAFRPTRFGLTLEAGLAAAGTVRPGAPTGSRVTGSAIASWLLAGTETAAQLIGSAYTGIDGRPDDDGTEVGVAIRRVRVPVFGEPDLIVDAEVLRDFGELDGFYGSVGFGVELTPPFLDQRLTVTFGTRLHADDYDVTGGGRALEAGGGVRVVALMLGRWSAELSADGALLAADGRRAAGLARVGLVIR